MTGGQPKPLHPAGITLDRAIQIALKVYDAGSADLKTRWALRRKPKET